MKNVAIVIAGSGTIRDLSIKPGTTAKDILSELGLQNGALSKGANDAPFAASDNVYEAVTDGTKLFASDTADVGLAGR
mgnify:CR=1 FL=1